METKSSRHIQNMYTVKHPHGFFLNDKWYDNYHEITDMSPLRSWDYLLSNLVIVVVSFVI
jgi:hypothetical protein